jgi:hypothetical protein
MEISAAMNIHDLAMTKAVRHRAEAQDRQEKMHIQKQEQRKHQTGTLEESPEAMTNTVQQSTDPHLTSTRVERQVDTQAAKETVAGSEGRDATKTNLKETGNLVDIIT